MERTHAQKLSYRRFKALKRIWDIMRDRTLKDKQKFARIDTVLRSILNLNGIQHTGDSALAENPQENARTV